MCYENNFCTRRFTYLFLFIHEDDDIVYFRGCYNHFSQFLVFLFPSVVIMSTSKPTGVCLVNRWKKGSAERIETYCYESLTFFLELDEEVMKSVRLTETSENAGLNPDFMKVSKWYQEMSREDDVPHFSSSSRMSDVANGTERTSYQARETIEDDEERLTTKKGDMSPPLSRKVSNMRIRDDQALALHDFFSNSDQMHRASSGGTYTQACFDFSRSSFFPQSVKKTGIDVELINVSSYKCSILCKNMGSFNRKSEFRNSETLNKPIVKDEKFNISALSVLKEFWWNNYALVILTA